MENGENNIQLSPFEMLEIEQNLQRLLDSLPDPVVILKAERNSKREIEDFSYRLVNKAACTQLEMNCLEISGFFVSEVFPSFKESPLFARYSEVLSSGIPIEIASFEYSRFTHPYKTRSLYDIKIDRFCDGLMLVWHDSIKAAEQEAFIDRQKRQAEIINDVSRELSETLQDYQSLLKTVTRCLAEVEGDTCVLRLLNSEGNILSAEAFYHPDKEAMDFLKQMYSNSIQMVEDGLPGAAVVKGKPILIPHTDPLIIRNSVIPAHRIYLDKYPVYSYMAVPLKAGKEIIGVISMSRSKPGNPYCQEDLQFLQRLSDLSALAIHNARLYDQRLKEIKEKEFLEQKLRHSNRELEMFAYAASHDLQEPLRMVTGYLQLLMNKCQGKLDSKAEEYLTFALRGAKDMIELIGDMLTYSRLTTKTFSFEPVDLNLIIEKVIMSFSMQIGETGALINCSNLPIIDAEPVQMYQLFENLIGNALKYRSSKTPEITICCSNDPQDVNGSKYWKLSIEDNGIGISPEFFDRIFVMFQRLHEKSSYPGTGIGLALCKRIAENHSGKIWVESEPGKGSRFYITLPARHQS